jgi:hypothetical protein
MAKEPGPHPQIAANEAAQAEREKQARAGTKPAPHPSQAIAEALGTQPHTLDREALAAYQAGGAKKAAAAETEPAATGEATERKA